MTSLNVSHMFHTSPLKRREHVAAYIFQDSPVVVFFGKDKGNCFNRCYSYVLKCMQLLHELYFI